MIEVRPLEVTDFTQGITDYFIDGNETEAESLDNFFLRPNGKPITRWGSQPDINSQIPLGQFRISKISSLWDSIVGKYNILCFAQKRLYTHNGSTWSETLSPTSNPPFSLGDANSLVSTSEWRGHLLAANSDFSGVQKIFYDSTSTLKAQSAGLPVLPQAGFSILPPSGTGSSYSYLAIFRYEYTVGQTTHLDRGPLTFYPSVVSGGSIASGNGATVSLPTTLTDNENYDVANLQVEIYRTLNGAADYFLVGTVPFGTPSFIDGVPDATLSTGTPIYSSSISRSAPPKCKYVQVVNDIGYYAHIKEANGEIDRYKVMQSVPSDADSVPSSFFETVEQEITGMSSIFDRPIIFCTRYIYRVDQFIASDGSGLMDIRRIDDRAGCVSNLSIVQTHRGLFWAGAEGFFWSDGFKVKNLSKHINETYQNIVRDRATSERIYGSFDPSTERIFWSVSTSGGPETDTIFVLDLKFTSFREGEQSRGCFTTLSGGDNFQPSSTLVLNDVIYRADERGFLFNHNRSLFSDPLVDITKPDLSTWFTTPILYSYKSCFLDFGSKFVRKFVPRILISAANKTNLSLAIRSSNDNDRTVGDLKPISYKQNITWGDALPVWGDPTAGWNLQGVIEQWRRFPAGGLRCQYKQIQFYNDTVEIISSALFGDVSVNSTAKTITLNGASQFPTGLENYNVQISSDSYSTDFRVLSQSANTLVLEDTTGSMVTGTYSFKVVGIPKNEILELNGYVFNWAYLSRSHTPYSSGV